MQSGFYGGIGVAFFFWQLAVALCVAPGAAAAELRPETIKAWNRFIAAQEKRIAAEISSPRGFLAMDFQEKNAAAAERRAVLAGQVVIKPMTVSAGAELEIPGGEIHHWRGAVFIAGVDWDFAMRRLRHPELEKKQQEDVLASRVLERQSDNRYRLYLKLKRTKIVTVIYNTEHLVRFEARGDGRYASSSIASKIAEVEKIDERHEREKPEGRDRGFLWKMNSYWRYQRVTGGLIVECESMTLSRSIPTLLSPVARPIINDVAGESMERTLDSLRKRMLDAWRTQRTS